MPPSTQRMTRRGAAMPTRRTSLWTKPNWTRRWRVQLRLALKVSPIWFSYNYHLDLSQTHWVHNYKLKLRFCWRIANFQADSKKSPEQVEFREQKRNTLIELIDILDDNEASEYLLNQEIVAESMIMVSKNVYRTFSNKSKWPPSSPFWDLDNKK